jgi:hypothetical protein
MSASTMKIKWCNWLGHRAANKKDEVIRLESAPVILFYNECKYCGKRIGKPHYSKKWRIAKEKR